MTDVLLHLLEFSLPAGFLGSAVAWVLSRKTHEARSQKEIHDTYKQMYEKESKMLLDVHDTYIKLYDAFIKIERATAKASACPYYYSSDCPVRLELCKPKRGGERNAKRKRNTVGQRKSGDGASDESDPDTGIAGDTESGV